jgi:RHS repeat-associated protein
MFRRFLILTIVFSFLFQSLSTPFVYAEEVRMDYTDPNHLHAPKVVSGVTYEYDENGNLVNDGERTIEWSQDNLPIKITKGNTEVRFFYDASGTRIAKETKDLTTGNITNKTIYVNQYLTIKQGNNVTSNNLTIYQKYYFANGRIAQRTGSNLVFLHQDHLGSTVLATNNQSQSTSDSLSYFPYGSSVNNLTIQQFSNYLYTGQELDDETDFYNYNARLYNPKTGVFISADTVGGGNRYAYANNNPMMFVDPSGHDAWYQDPRMSQGGLSLAELYAFGGAQWSNYGALMTSFPREWYEANLPYWNGEMGTIPGTNQAYTPGLAEQLVLGELRPELQNQITNQVVGSAFVDSYQSAAALGGLAMAGGLGDALSNLLRRDRDHAIVRAPQGVSPEEMADVMVNEYGFTRINLQEMIDEDFYHIPKSVERAVVVFDPSAEGLPPGVERWEVEDVNIGIQGAIRGWAIEKGGRGQVLVITSGELDPAVFEDSRMWWFNGPFEPGFWEINTAQGTLQRYRLDYQGGWEPDMEARFR